MTTRKRHSPEQVVRKLATADRMLGEGTDIAAVCRELQISEQTSYRWRNQFGGLKADDAKRLKEGLPLFLLTTFRGGSNGRIVPPGHRPQSQRATRPSLAENAGDVLCEERNNLRERV